MGKINKYANIYKDGELIRHVNEDGRLDSYTITEVEELVDKLANDKDENGNIKDQQALNNANSWLFGMYQKYGNPHESEILEMLKQSKKKETQKEEIERKLTDMLGDENGGSEDGTESNESNDVQIPTGNGIQDQLEVTPREYDETIMDQYVDFEEVA